MSPCLYRRVGNQRIDQKRKIVQVHVLVRRRDLVVAIHVEALYGMTHALQGGSVGCHPVAQRLGQGVGGCDNTAQVRHIGRCHRAGFCFGIAHFAILGSECCGQLLRCRGGRDAVHVLLVHVATAPGPGDVFAGHVVIRVAPKLVGVFDHPHQAGIHIQNIDRVGTVVGYGGQGSPQLVDGDDV